jgi:hypothetical protein
MNPEVRKSQLLKVSEAYGKGPATMLMIARATGIERAGVCRYVATLRKADQIYFVRKGLCPITRHAANFLTTNEAYRPSPTDWTLF